MPKFSVSRNVPYSVEQVFAVVADVARYREFLPLVAESSVFNLRELENGKTSFDSDVRYAYKKLNISDTLRSHVVVDPSAHTVTATASEGPVKSLHTEWKILPGATGGSDIHFTVDYTLKSRSLQFIVSGMFDMAVRKIMNAFEERVRSLHA